MATRPRTRKRVYAIRRAPDGSAFQKCERCGVLVAVALSDMHECEPKMEAKRFKGMNGKRHVPKQSFMDLPISPFRLFMENFEKTSEIGSLIEIDRMGFETWKNMSKQERQPYVFQAGRVNSAYQEALNEEMNDMNMIKVNDEADSAVVGKFDKFHWIFEESSESSQIYSHSSEHSPSYI